MSELKTIDYHLAEQEDKGPLYVMNNVEPRGAVNLNCPTSRGKENLVRIPATWVPIDLTTMGSRNDILDSSDFRRIVSTGLVTIMDSKSVTEYYADDESAREELKRVTLATTKAGDMSELKASINAARQQKLTNRSVEEKSSSEATVNGITMNIVARANSEEDGGISSKEAISILKGQNLSEVDLQYILENSNPKDLRDYAAKALNG